jgi:hypothetical protein
VLARAGTGDYDVIEGDWQPHRLVIIEFPSLGAIHEFYHDPEFQPAKKARQAVPGAVANGRRRRSELTPIRASTGNLPIAQGPQLIR